jgi:hypothetical protein
MTDPVILEIHRQLAQLNATLVDAAATIHCGVIAGRMANLYRLRGTAAREEIREAFVRLSGRQQDDLMAFYHAVAAGLLDEVTDGP